MAIETFGTVCRARAQTQQSNTGIRETQKTDTDQKSTPPSGPDTKTPDPPEVTNESKNKVGLPLVKNILLDQKTIWTSPLHIQWTDSTWLLPIAGATTGLLFVDRPVNQRIANDPVRMTHYGNLSNYGVAAMVGAGGGLYLWGRIAHDEKKRETGVLAGEAMIDALGVNTALQYAIGRERPFEDNGRILFFHGGTSFPSDHSAAAWAAASVYAHEYPGYLSQFLAYGMASAVSAARVEARQHSLSDVFVGAAIGWLIGRQVYRAHHDQDLGGEVLKRLSGGEDEDGNWDRQNMGSPFVPLNDWEYSAFERLAARGYISLQIMGLKPWTRIECARLTEEAQQTLQNGDDPDPEMARIEERLRQEFAYELGILDGGHNVTANVESVYARGVSISGPDLSNSYHFGQTISYDFGRPFERGMNGQIGGAASAAVGPLVVYVNAEYQHAPSAPALSPAALNAISIPDGIPVSREPSGALAAINRLQLMDAYVGFNWRNWEIVAGRQSLSWTPGPDGSMLWSNNAPPVDMVRLINPEAFYLPWILRYVGAVKLDQFFGRMGGHSFIPRPYIYGQKINFKPSRYFEWGIARTVEIGGKGSNNPLTTANLFRSFFFQVDPRTGQNPGDVRTEMDWTFYVPKVRNYLILYGDAYAEDDVAPIQNPPRNPWHPGIYITRFPRLTKLDFHIEGVSTEQPGLCGGVGEPPGGPLCNLGMFNYWSHVYRDGYTNGGYLIGNAVGRDGRTIQSWLTYWLSPTNNLQLIYKHNSVNSTFIPGGGAWQDYEVKDEFHLRSGLYLKSELQFEHISRYPVLFTSPQNNFTAIVEIGFSPRDKEPN